LSKGIRETGRRVASEKVIEIETQTHGCRNRAVEEDPYSEPSLAECLGSEQS
jgi:hypothetical protein